MRTQGRRIHLIDVENLLGTGYLTQTAVQWLQRTYTQHMHVGADQHVIVAASSWEGAAAAGFGWPSARLLWERGPNGADRCLVDVLQHEHLGDRFADVVLASGDHAFAAGAAAVVRSGCTVTVVSREASLSTWLRAAATSVLTPAWLETQPTFPITARVAWAA